MRISIPVREEAKGACEILGLDPLYVANEGKLIAIVAAEIAEQTRQSHETNRLRSERLHHRRSESRTAGHCRDAHGFWRHAHRGHAGRRAVAADLLDRPTTARPLTAELLLKVRGSGPTVKEGVNL